MMSAHSLRMTTVFEELENEHNAQRTLMRIMLKTSGDSQGRRELFARFRDSLETHAAAEERVLYSPLLAEEEGRKCAAHSIEEHQEMRDMLEALEHAANDSSSWLHWAQKLVDKNLHHMREEEEEIFPLAARLFATARKRDLAGEYAAVHAQEQAQAAS